MSQMTYGRTGECLARRCDIRRLWRLLPRGRLGGAGRREPKENPRGCHGREVSGRNGDPATHWGIPQADLDDLRARIVATPWPEKEPVEDLSQGVQLATMQALARYWADEYDWHKCDETDALPHFITRDRWA